MLDESHFIPFSDTQLPGVRWLVFAPHADDESIGMGGSLSLAQPKGVNVCLVIMTDGSRGADVDDPAFITTTRRTEAQQAAAVLGIEQIVFLEQSDRQLSPSVPLITRITEIITKTQPDTVFIPSMFEYHPDHRACATIVWDCLKSCAYSGNLFWYDISCHSPVNHLVDISGVIEQKQAAINCYHSQLSQNNYLQTTLALNSSRTYTLPGHIRYAEAFRQLDLQQYASLYQLMFDTLQPYWSDGLVLNYHAWMNSQQQLQQMQVALSELQSQNLQLLSNTQLLYQSTSWKITAPLRWFKQTLSSLYHSLTRK